MAKTRKTRSRAKTQKAQKKHKQVMTIPELRSSIDHMEACANKLVSSKVSLPVAAKEFASEWKRVLGKQLSTKAATEFLKTKMKHHKYSKTRRHQRGGNHGVIGAPLDHITRPGADIPYGNFLRQVSNGFWNPGPALLRDGASQQVDPYPTTGSNKMNGGGLLDSLGTSFAAALNRPVTAQNPLTASHVSVLSFKGLPTGPGAASYDNPMIQKL